MQVVEILHQLRQAFILFIDDLQKLRGTVYKYVEILQLANLQENPQCEEETDDRSESTNPVYYLSRLHGWVHTFPIGEVSDRLVLSLASQVKKIVASVLLPSLSMLPRWRWPRAASHSGNSRWRSRRSSIRPSQRMQKSP